MRPVARPRISTDRSDPGYVARLPELKTLPDGQGLAGDPPRLFAAPFVRLFMITRFPSLPVAIPGRISSFGDPGKTAIEALRIAISDLDAAIKYAEDAKQRSPSASVTRKLFREFAASVHPGPLASAVSIANVPPRNAAHCTIPALQLPIQAVNYISLGIGIKRQRNSTGSSEPDKAFCRPSGEMAEWSNAPVC